MPLNFSKIGLYLKRYSFESKMCFCFRESALLIELSGFPIEQMIGRHIPYPWELEVFLLFSIVSDEISQKKLDNKDFVKIINCIRKYHPRELSQDYMIAYQFLTAMTLTQFDIQIPFLRRLYRYNYFFNYHDDKINMSKVFFEKFGSGFENFLELAGYLQFAFGEKKYYNDEILYYLLTNKYKEVFKVLAITRDDYQVELKQYAKKDEDFAYCVRPSYTYAFIQYGEKVYFPLPHLLARNITNSLLFRMTKDNGKMRSDFGTVFEHYVFDILKETHRFNEIYPEKKYRHGQSYQTSDIMCRLNSDYLFFECKFSVPQTDVRNFVEESFTHEVDKFATNIIQLYKSFNRFIEHKEYSPFLETHNIDNKNLWGIVAVLEYSNVDSKLVYSRVAEILNLNMESNEMHWICNHIKISGISSIERFCFDSLNFIDSLKKQEQENHLFDFAFCQIPEKVYFEEEKELKSLNDFTTYFKNRISIVMSDLMDKRFIS